MDKEQKALEYAEKHGIVDYKVKGNRMIYYQNFHGSLAEPKATYKVTVRLNTMTEERQKLNKYYPKGDLNR